MSFWSTLFGKKQKQPEFPTIEYKTPQQTVAGAELLPILKSRSQGQGVAFSPEELSMYQQPYAKAAMNTWQNYSLPAIEDMWASKGLGKSTMAGQSTIQGQTDLANQIGTNWAELNKWNEALKQSGISSGLAGLQDFTGMELNQANQQANVPLQKYGYDVANYQYNNSQPSLLQTALMTGGNILGAINGMNTQDALLSALLGKTQQTAPENRSVYSNFSLTPNKPSGLYKKWLSY